MSRFALFYITPSPTGICALVNGCCNKGTPVVMDMVREVLWQLYIFLDITGY